MKKIYVLAGLSLLALAACNKVNAPEQEAWVNDESLPVPIQFGLPALDIETKANEGPLTSLDNVSIGLFGVSVTGDYGAKTPTWSGVTDGTIILANEKVDIANAGQMDVPGKYYPLSNEREYSFYAYGPYVDLTGSENGLVLNGRFEVPFDLGYTDIIWAESHAQTISSDGLNGFNAAYARRIKNSATYSTLMPNLKFEHLLTQLVMNVTASDNIRVQEIKLTGEPTKATLVVVGNGSYSAQTKTLRVTERGEVALYNKTTASTDFTNTVLSDSATELSQFLVIPAASYQVSVTFGIYDQGAFVDTNTVSGTIQLSSQNEMAAGSSYDVNINIASPEQIMINTSLTAWRDSGATITPDLQ